MRKTHKRTRKIAKCARRTRKQNTQIEKRKKSTITAAPTEISLFAVQSFHFSLFFLILFLFFYLRPEISILSSCICCIPPTLRHLYVQDTTNSHHQQCNCFPSVANQFVYFYAFFTHFLCFARSLGQNLEENGCNL